MHHDRLQHLITILGKVQPSRLDMRNWFDDKQHPCGTVACVVGHACLDPVFREQGLKVFLSSPSFGGVTGWDAAQAFFGLNQRDVLHLFDPEFYPGSPTPADVIARIRALLEEESPT